MCKLIDKFSKIRLTCRRLKVRDLRSILQADLKGYFKVPKKLLVSHSKVHKDPVIWFGMSFGM